MKRVLNVGGGTGGRLPPMFDDWKCDILDIDPSVNPQICCDAKDMVRLQGGQYDAIMCSHMLEHVHRHEAPQVLAGFAHVLKSDGFAYIIVPDIAAVIKKVMEKGGEIDDMWYVTNAGVHITFHDALYGWGLQIQKGNDFFCHKTGYTEKSMTRVLRKFFSSVLIAHNGFDLFAYAFRKPITAARRRALDI